MTTLAIFEKPMLSDVGGWFLRRFIVYGGIMAAAGGLFVVGSGIYALVAKPPTLVAPSSIQEEPVPLPLRPPASRAPASMQGELIAGFGDAKLKYSGVIGAPIYDSAQQPAGQVTDILLNTSKGTADAAIIALNGHWLTRKYVVMPFGEIHWSGSDTTSHAMGSVVNPSKGFVPYSISEMQAFRPVGDPLLPRVPPSRTGN